MCRKSPSLEALISAEIESLGPMTFARFMELALYHPAHGYYSSGQASIGKAGDFFTSVSVGPLFGQLLARQFEEMWAALGKPERFTLVEQGANDGQLALDILSTLKGDFAQACEYCIIEPLDNLQARQREKLHGQKVSWRRDVTDLSDFEGVHFSNELIDALPFHLLRSNGESWEESHVAMEEGRFVFLSRTPSEAVLPLLSSLPRRPAGTMAELRPAAALWMNQLSAKLRRGFILVIDYGFPREKMFARHRHEGTFSCYRDHKRDAKPLEDPGLKDITSHVDFSALAESALTAGLRIEGFADQHHFLVGASESLLRALDGAVPDAATRKTLNALRTLLHPESMGTQFHYLAFSKNLPNPSSLSGFRHARDPRTVLFTESGE